MFISEKNRKTKLVMRDLNVCLQADTYASGARHMCEFKTRLNLIAVLRGSESWSLTEDRQPDGEIRALLGHSTAYCANLSLNILNVGPIG